ncbi:tetratricopeptide repeat protein [Ruegeria sp. 6PALISEP08]|uniref:tetratricopeptide repeat protein n=1 Tax=Ruegeria sp. 6PALISEP08 TaxID=1225660 RepID=UPI00067F5A71|nr:adenylate cyclase [Ruegeria sp. 6PALISEP08]
MGADSETQQTDMRSASTAEIETALKHVLQSDEFRGSSRMQSFLTYVVKEALSGRAENIRAKTIAMDVYGYDVDDLSKREGVVRVDAGRVRRKLDAYYERNGTSDPVIISLPIGSYAPEFTLRTNARRGARRPLFAAFLLTLSAFLIASIAGFYVWYGSSSTRLSKDRPIIYDVAPARIEAMNLCNAGRELIFPVVTLSRLRPALQIFETAVARDPDYFCGYAGAAQVKTMLALLQPERPDIEILLKQAEKNSARAIEFAPDDPWALSARAWFEFGSGNYDRALTLSGRAVQMAPQDPHIAEFDALILLYTSRFDQLLEQSDHYKQLAKSGGGLVFDNALGSAQFHSGEYAAAIKTFETTIARGGPFGPISAAYLMAAHWKNGERKEAQRLAGMFNQTWPDFPLETIKRRAFSTAEPVESLIDAMKAAGWTQQSD